MPANLICLRCYRRRDTATTNDGGVMDDSQMRGFWKRALGSANEKQQRTHAWAATHGTNFTCANPASCGSSAGVSILQQQRPGSVSRFELMKLSGSKDQQAQDQYSAVAKVPAGQKMWVDVTRRGGHVEVEVPSGTSVGDSFQFTVGAPPPPWSGRSDKTEVWRLQTVNVARLRIDSAQMGFGPQPSEAQMENNSKLQLDLDGFIFIPTRRSSTVFCRNQQLGSNRWHQCLTDAADPTCDSDTAEQQQLEQEEAQCCRVHELRRVGERGAGPMRRVLAAPFVCVYGTNGGTATSEHYRHAAVTFANAWAAVAGGVTRVVPDNSNELFLRSSSHVPAEAPRVPAGINVILFGGPKTNLLAAALSSHQPFQFDNTSDSGHQRLENGFAIGSCSYRGADIGLVALGPTASTGAPAIGGLAVTIAGTSLKGFSNA